MYQKAKVVEVELIVTRKYRTTMTVRSTDMDDMTSTELIATYFDLDEASLEHDTDEDAVEIDDYQYTMDDW